MRLKFRLEAEAGGSRARAGAFWTLHGEVRTPVFMPVGTRATVRAQPATVLEDSGAQVLLANTYHLLLRPGPEVFRSLGGIHGFMGWKGSVLTDSGGFQVFSLAQQRTMREEGAEFRAHPDGPRVLLSPERSIETQMAIGSDIMMAMDQCVPSTCAREEAAAAMELTHRWAARSLAARGDSPQALFGIVQGATFPELRRASARALTELPFDGYAIGGLAVGESRAEREDTTALTAELLPRELPRYLMGVGTPIDLLEGVHRGVDMFDCILPTSLAQQGVAFTSRGRLDLRRGVYRLSQDALDPACGCPACARHSRAYLHHLIKSEEVLGWQLIGAHNLHFYQSLMRGIRSSILEGRFEGFYREWKPVLESRDEENPSAPPKRKRRKAPPPRALGDFEIVVSPQGFASVRQISSGETMHPAGDPAEEARRLYVEQPRLEERLSARSGGERALVVWDVGLGAATNAMAAISAWERVARAAGPEPRPLTIVSFERDLDPLRLAAAHPVLFPHLRHGAPGSLLARGVWEREGGGLRWILHEGDFLAKLAEAELPDLVYYDPFSFKTDSELWSLGTFRRLRRRFEGRAVELLTYSASTAVRAALLGAGFRVGRGVSTGPKAETTIVFTPEALAPAPERLLGEEWLKRWERSGARVPHGLEAGEIAALEDRIRAHPQFAPSAR